MNELHLAVLDDSTERTVALLINGSAHIGQKNQHVHTPLIFAAVRGNVDIVRILLNRGANASVAADGGGTAFQGRRRP